MLEADHSPKDPAPIELAYNQSHVAARLTFEQMLRSVLPLSEWWQEYLWPGDAESVAAMLDARRAEIIAGLREPMREQGRKPTDTGELSGTLIWFSGSSAGSPGRRRTPTTTSPTTSRPTG